MEVHFLGRLAMNFPFRSGDAAEDRDGFLLYPRGEFRTLNQFPNLAKCSAVFMFMLVSVVFWLVLAQV